MCACMCLCASTRLYDLVALSIVRLTSALQLFLHMLQLPHPGQLTVTGWLQHSEPWQPKGLLMFQSTPPAYTPQVEQIWTRNRRKDNQTAVFKKKKTGFLTAFSLLLGIDVTFRRTALKSGRTCIPAAMLHVRAASLLPCCSPNRRV